MRCATSWRPRAERSSGVAVGSPHTSVSSTAGERRSSRPAEPLCSVYTSVIFLCLVWGSRGPPTSVVSSCCRLVTQDSSRDRDIRVVRRSDPKFFWRPTEAWSEVIKSCCCTCQYGFRVSAHKLKCTSGDSRDAERELLTRNFFCRARGGSLGSVTKEPDERAGRVELRGGHRSGRGGGAGSRVVRR